MATKMKAAQIGKPGGNWELVERQIPEPQGGSYPLARVAEAYEQMHSGRVRFRVVLTMSE